MTGLKTLIFVLQPDRRKIKVAEWEEALDKIIVRKEDMNKLVMDFLVTEVCKIWRTVQPRHKFRCSDCTRLMQYCTIHIMTFAKASTQELTISTARLGPLSRCKFSFEDGRYSLFYQLSTF